MNTLKAKMIIHCGTCGDPMKKTKSIKVKSSTEIEAKKEAEAAIEVWKKRFKGANCKVCKSIIDSVGN